MRRNNVEKQIVAYERRMKILQLRLAGASYPQIARELQAEYGASLRGWGPRLVARDLFRLLEQMRERSQEDIDAARELELMRLDDIYFRLQSALENGDYSVVDKMLRVIELRAKLLGLFPRIANVEPDDVRPMLRIVVSVSNINSTVLANDK